MDVQSKVLLLGSFRYNLMKVAKSEILLQSASVGINGVVGEAEIPLNLES